MSEVGLIITPMSRLLFHHHGVDPKIPRPRFANGSRSEVPLDTGFNQPITMAAESALKAYGLWASGDPVRRDSPVGRVRYLLAKMVRRHAVYAERPVPTEDRVVLTLGVGSSTDTLVIEMRLRPATIYVRTFGTFSVPRKGETTTKVYEREYLRPDCCGGWDLSVRPDPVRVLTAIAYPNNSLPDSFTAD